MTARRLILTLAAMAATTGAVGGCQEQASPPPSGFTYDRGAALLAAGSPKSAIPFLTQTVESMPDGPEPVALLSLAYALDLQDERAILQARLVHRPANSEPGWEFVAAAIAKMTQHRPQDAIALLQRIVNLDPAENPAALPAREWLALAQVLNSQDDQAIGTLKGLSTARAMQTTTMLWIAIIREQHNEKKEALAALMQCAQATATQSGQMALGSSLGNADDQTLYDAAIAAVAKGELSTASTLFRRVQDHASDPCDTIVWLSLIAGVQENWQTARTGLQEACDAGRPATRGLANQLFSVVCALEDRPDTMIQCTLAGQRMMERVGGSTYTHEQPKQDLVWFSDQMK